MSHPLLEQVRVVKHRARRLVLLYALMFFLAAVISCGLFVGAADYAFRFQDLGWRIVGTAALLTTLIWAFLRFVFPVTRYSTSDVATAQRIERRFPHLSDRLSTAVAFLQQPATEVHAGSPLLREAAVTETQRALAGTQLDECLDTRATWRAGLTLLAVVTIAIGVCTWDPPASTLALRRMLLPFRQEAWPRRNALAWTKAPRRLAFGSDFECELTDAHGHLPDRVTLEYWPADAGPEARQSKPMKLLSDKMVGRIDNVSNSFRYRATGGDDDTMNWTTLAVVEPARVAEFSARLLPPAYTRLPPSSSGRHIRAWAGTQITVRGLLDKPVRKLSLVANGAGKQQRFSAAFEHDGRHFSIPATAQTPWIVQDSGTYWLELQDRNEFTSRELTGSELRIQKDAPPTISLAAPNVGAYFTAQAVVPIRAVTKDDLAIRSVELTAGTHKKELYRAPETPANATAGTAGSSPQLGETRVVDYDWSLSELPGLTPGDTVDFRLVASDQQPQLGYTAPIRIAIISSEELETRIDQRQSSLGERLREALEIQRTAHEQTQSLQIKLQTNGRMSRDDSDSLQAIELSQRRVQQILKAPADGAAALVDLLLEELHSNRVERPQLTDRLTQLKAAVSHISEELLLRIQFELTRALKESKTALDAVGTPGTAAPGTPPPTVSFGNPLQEPIATAETIQVEVIDKLEGILDLLSEWEDYRRLAQDVATLRQRQDDIFRGTQSLSSTGQDLASLPAEQRATLKRLSRRQLDLARELDRLQSRLAAEDADRLDPTPVESAAIKQGIETLRRRNMSGEMRDSAQHLDANQVGQAAQQQQAVLAGLSELLDVLARRNDHDPQRLARESAAAEQLSGLRQSVADWLVRQQSLKENTQSRHLAPQASALPDLSRQQQQLSEELLELTTATVLPSTFRFGIQRAAQPMQEAARSLAQGTTGEVVQQSQSLALRRLEALQNSLTTQPPPESGTPTENGAGPEAPETGKISLAELILLQSLQSDINERTAALASLEQLPEPPSPEQQATLLELAEDQARLVQVLEQALSAGAEEPKPPPRATPAEPDSDLDRALEAAGVPGFSGQ